MHPTSLALHPHFANHHNLRDGQRVIVTVVERVNQNPTSRVRYALLKPLHQRDESIFESLSVAADTLERVALTQIRVLSNGLTFPLALPAGVIVFLTVVRIQSENNQEDHPYSILFPGAQLVVEPPPTTGPALKLCARLISYSKALSSLPLDLLNSSAFIHGQPNSRIQYAYISRRSSRPDDVRIPVCFQQDTAIPKGHIWLPVHVWTRLSLTPLSRIVLEQVAPFRHGPSELRIQPAPISNSHPPFSEIAAREGVYYNGMRIREGVVRIADNPAPQQKVQSDIWDGSVEGAAEKDLLTDWDCYPCTDQVLEQPRGKIPPIVPGFVAFLEQTMLHVQKKQTDIPDLVEMSDLPREKVPPFNPMHDMAIVESAQKLTESVRNTIDEAIAFARAALNPGTGYCGNKILVIQAPEGCGKTLVCYVMAAVLRLVPRFRTVWVRCHAHAKEPVKDTVQRIRETFREAMLARPAVVVLDDADVWLTEGTGEKEERAAREQVHNVVADEIEQRTKVLTDKPIMTVITCTQFRDLSQRLRAPGLVGEVLKMDVPNCDERAFLLWHLLVSVAPELGNDTTSQDDLVSLKLRLYDIAKATEGFSTRGMQALKPLSGGEPSGVVDEMHRRVAKRRELMGWSKASSDEDMKRAWDCIGAAEHVKEVLDDVLNLQSSYPEMFRDAPIQMPKSVLLYGPPGCGKTMIAKAAAAYSGKSCIVVKGPELMSKYIGESEAEVRRAFEKATRQRPCVLLFDEFDSIAPRRGSGTGVTDRVVNSLLTCMDGAERLADEVYILATSSRPETIDPAVLRPGRIDKWVEVGIPKDVEERVKIVKAISLNQSNPELLTPEQLNRIATETDGYTGADLGAIIGDVPLQLRKLNKNGRSSKGDKDLVECALDMAMMNSRPSISRSQRRHYHETMTRFNPGRRGDSQGSRLPPEQRVTLQ